MLVTRSPSRSRIGHALLVDNGLRRRTEVGPDFVEHILQFAYFVECQRSSRVAFHAADAAAGIEVAAETFRQDVG